MIVYTYRMHDAFCCQAHVVNFIIATVIGLESRKITMTTAPIIPSNIIFQIMISPSTGMAKHDWMLMVTMTSTGEISRVRISCYGGCDQPVVPCHATSRVQRLCSCSDPS